MDPTRAGETGHVKAVAPSVGRLGPLGGPPVVADVLARGDRAAVDESRGEGLELAADRRSRRLVEERQSLVHLAPAYESHSLSGEGERLDVAFTQPLAELVGLVEVRHRVGGPPEHRERVQAMHQHQMGVLRRLRHAVEEAFRLSHPSVRDGEGPA